MHLVIEFQEEYKRLDKLCKDIFYSEEGVSEYIRQMEKILWTNKKNVYMLEEEYKYYYQQAEKVFDPVVE